VALAGFGLGLIFLLFGLKMNKAIVFISGFLNFYAGAFTISGAYDLVQDGKFNDSKVIIGFLASIIFGILGGYLALYFHKLATFFLGFAFGGSLIYFIGIQINLGEANTVKIKILRTIFINF